MYVRVRMLVHMYDLSVYMLICVHICVCFVVAVVSAAALWGA